MKILLTISSLMFFINHFAYLAVGRFDYNYNMKANIITGMKSALVLLILFLIILLLPLPFAVFSINLLWRRKRNCDWYCQYCFDLNFPNDYLCYRRSNWSHMGDLVFDAKEETSVCLEDTTFPSTGGNFLTTRSQWFSTAVLGIRCPCLVAFIDRFAYNITL